MTYLLTVLLAAIASNVYAAAGDEALKPFPPPAAGFLRMVFQLPAVENEAEHKVEIIIGMTMMIDCNRTWFGGDLAQQVAKGWGYPYFVLSKVIGPASTRMACPPGESRTEAFVQVRGNGYFHAYNSKLPVVTYVPEGFSVRYRIWTAGDDIRQAKVR